MIEKEEEKKYVVKTDLTPIGELFSSLNKNKLIHREYENDSPENKLIEYAPKMAEKFFGLPKESFNFRLNMNEEEMLNSKRYNLISEIKATSDLFLSPDWKIGELSIMISPHHADTIERYNDCFVSNISSAEFEFESNWGESISCNSAGEIIAFFQKKLREYKDINKKDSLTLFRKPVRKLLLASSREDIFIRDMDRLDKEFNLV